MVELHNIAKSYNKGAVKALNDISFAVDKGELFGLVGPDGAGKTSLFRILTTLILPDSGTATVAGFNVVKHYRAIRKIVGYMPGRFSLYQDLTVEENLNFFASVFNTSLKENYDLIRDIYIQIEPFKDRRAGKLSGGMKQKLALCCALIHRPEVLFLDEPTTGVDVVSRREFWEMLKNLKQQGITILVSTPYMDEATLCERILLIQNGNVLSINTPDQIVRQFPTDLFAVKSDHMSQLLLDLRNNAAIQTCFAFGEYHHITFRQQNSDDPPYTQLSQVQQIHRLVSDLERAHHRYIDIKKITATIEDCFINLMK